MKLSFVFFADGFEEIEAITVVDVMRRAGIDVRTVSINDGRSVVGAHGVEICADMLIGDVDADGAEWLVMPGGMPGAVNLSANAALTEMLRAHYRAGGKIAAICAAPAVVLAPLGILDGREATCYPGFESACGCKAVLSADRVVALDTLITANGPSSAMAFALAIVAASKGEAVAREVAGGMLCQD